MKKFKESIPEDQKSIINKIEEDVLESSNMSVGEAYEFAYKCWQFGYTKKEDNKSSQNNCNKEVWSHGTFGEFNEKLKSGILRHVDHYSGYIGYLDSSNYELYDGPTVLGDGVHDNIVYDIVYLSITKAILCSHNLLGGYVNWKTAKANAASYISGGYLPSIEEVTKWYTGSSKTTG